MPSQQDTIIRQLDMLRLIRREPAKITARSIHDKLRLHGFDVDKRTIELGSPIKGVGRYDATVRLREDVIAALSIDVVGGK